MMIRLLTAMLLFTPLASAQAVPIGLRPKPLLLLGGVGITVSTPTVNLVLSPGAVSASQPVSLTTTVTGIGVASTLVMTAYFASTSALTTTAGDTILSSQVLASCSTCLPTSFTAFSQSSTFAAASSLSLVNQSTLLTILGGTRTDTLNLKVDLTSTPQTPAGSYSGTLVVATQVF